MVAEDRGTRVRALARVDDRAGGVHDPARRDQDGGADPGLDRDRREAQRADPADGEVDDHGDPLRGVYPDQLDDDPGDRSGPDRDEERRRKRPLHDEERKRGHGAGDQQEDHGVIEAAHPLARRRPSPVDAVIERTRPEQRRKRGSVDRGGQGRLAVGRGPDQDRPGDERAEEGPLVRDAAQPRLHLLDRLGGRGLCLGDTLPGGGLRLVHPLGGGNLGHVDPLAGGCLRSGSALLGRVELVSELVPRHLMQMRSSRTGSEAEDSANSSEESA